MTSSREECNQIDQESCTTYRDLRETKPEHDQLTGKSSQFARRSLITPIRVFRNVEAWNAYSMSGRIVNIKILSEGLRAGYKNWHECELSKIDAMNAHLTP